MNLKKLIKIIFILLKCILPLTFNIQYFHNPAKTHKKYY